MSSHFRDGRAFEGRGSIGISWAEREKVVERGSQKAKKMEGGKKVKEK